MNIIVSQEEPSQLQYALEVCSHLFILFMYIKFNYHMKYYFSNVLLHKRKKKIEPIQHIRQDDQE
jgi:hypothetical protein